MKYDAIYLEFVRKKLVELRALEKQYLDAKDDNISAKLAKGFADFVAI